MHCSYMFKYVEQVTLSSKILLMRSLVTTIFLYNCESWTFTAELQSHGNEVLPQDATNEEVRAKIHRAIGPQEDLLTIVKRRKLMWYGHVSRSSGLTKTVLKGTVKGGRRKGRQSKRWEDLSLIHI